jgi:membrane fusion protein (multidrug efflux system)
MNAVSIKTDKIPKKGWFRRNGPKLIIVIAAIAVLTGISKIPKRERQAPPTEAAVVNVTVMNIVSLPEFEDTFKLPAVIEPNRIITVSAEVSGRIEEIPKVKGMTVEANDVLVKLNTDLIEPELQRAEAQVERDQIQYERMTNLVKDDATSKKDLDDAKTNLAISKATLAENQARMERASIVSPITGPLNDLMVERGEYVQPGTPVAEIVDMSSVKVVVEVPERDVPFFSVGRQATVTVNKTGQEEELTGKITFISEIANDLTHTTRMEITIPNSNMVLRSGQIVEAHLRRRTLKDVILIPLLAVIPMEEGHSIYVVNDSTEVERRDVKLGIIKGDSVQVTKGLEAGDKLIVSGHRLAAPGQKVNIISEI